MNTLENNLKALKIALAEQEIAFAQKGNIIHVAGNTTIHRVVVSNENKPYTVYNLKGMVGEYSVPGYVAEVTAK